MLVLHFILRNIFNKIENDIERLTVVASNCYIKIIEPRREKTGFLHMRKQRRRSASR